MNKDNNETPSPIKPRPAIELALYAAGYSPKEVEVADKELFKKIALSYIINLITEDKAK